MRCRAPVALFAGVEAGFAEHVRSVVWRGVATIDPRDPPRSCLLPPIWEGETGWVATLRHPHTGAKHLADNPYVWPTYVADVPTRMHLRPACVACRADWEEAPPLGRGSGIRLRRHRTSRVPGV